ncbi:MAG: hypothetical protein KatS3mg089_0179 [Patescibacteria group bacterium]|nr:MAG: hypothetical protein KatS3mg089_0179 [Patescibacteria group bacterium]
MKITTANKAKFITQKLIKEGKILVLAGGCFDLLHEGHKSFLKKAKEEGDILIVMLESDIAIKIQKGKNRPVEQQSLRAQKLAKLPYVDFVVLLEGILTDEDYDSLVTSLKPAIIATTKGDPYRYHKDRQAAEIGAKVKEVINRIEEFSTTRCIKLYE